MTSLKSLILTSTLPPFPLPFFPPPFLPCYISSLLPSFLPKKGDDEGKPGGQSSQAAVREARGHGYSGRRGRKRGPVRQGAGAKGHGEGQVHTWEEEGHRGGPPGASWWLRCRRHRCHPTEA